jgi:hypothetical protein
MATTRNYSSLDQNQIMQRAFDEAADALRVQTEAVVIANAMEVAISDRDDSIRLGDGTNLTQVNPDGSLKVSTGLVKDSYDYFSGSHTDTTSTYVYRRGGISGTVVATVQIVYADSNKDEIVSLSVT